jgi:predicted ester cyclase
MVILIGKQLNMKTLIKPLLALSLCSGSSLNAFTQGNSNQSNSKTREVIMTSIQSEVENKAVVRKLYEVSFNTGNFELTKDLIAEEFIGPNGQKGSTQLIEQIKALRTGFPDIKWTVDDLVAEGDKVVIRSSWKGTHTGPFRNYDITRKAIANSAMAIYQFKDGKIIRSWLETDRLGFLIAIDVLPDNIVPPPTQRN